jgi:predicted membrane-bound mannosyltransferase
VEAVFHDDNGRAVYILAVAKQGAPVYRPVP